jgi:hypothetical protein
VDANELVNLIKLAQKKNAGYLQLLSFHPYALVPSHDRIGEISKRARYVISLTIALWKREVLLKTLAPGESAWEIETKGGRHRAAALAEPFFSLSIESRAIAPIKDVHLVIRGKITREAIALLKKEHWDHSLGNRQTVSLFCHIYVRLAHLYWDLYYAFRWSIAKARYYLNSASSIHI